MSKLNQKVDCCDTSQNQEVRSRSIQKRFCPICGTKGKNVGIETVKAMLAVTLHEIPPGSDYLFCSTEDCSIVYFANEEESTFVESELREKVYQKHLQDDNVFVCYCFRHTPGSIRVELMGSGQSTVVNAVTAGTKNHQCACEIRNPQGSCCLGNVRAVVARVKQEVDAMMLTKSEEVFS